MINGTESANYQELYAEMPDPLHGHYLPLYTRFLDPNELATSLFTYSMLTNGEPPMVHLDLVEVGGRPFIKVTHQIATHKVRLTQTTCDGHVYSFSGNVYVNDHIDMVKVSDEMFERVEIDVRTDTDVDSQVLTWGNADDCLPPVDLDVDDCETVKVTKVIPVPQLLFNIVFTCQHTPGALWKELGGVMKQEGHEEQMEPLVDWMAAALHKQTMFRQPGNLHGRRRPMLPGSSRG
mmetsp:Transcript_14227/g.21701  ORF Transcript_14227/g.21701 Transcript_14227/m.21701 type:complete len:235 (-) Transcript_14227:229-933(-)